jgi:hypothetical protein
MNWRKLVFPKCCVDHLTARKWLPCWRGAWAPPRHTDVARFPIAERFLYRPHRRFWRRRRQLRGRQSSYGGLWRAPPPMRLRADATSQRSFASCAIWPALRRGRAEAAQCRAAGSRVINSRWQTFSKPMTFGPIDGAAGFEGYGTVSGMGDDYCEKSAESVVIIALSQA